MDDLSRVPTALSLAAATASGSEAILPWLPFLGGVLIAVIGFVSGRLQQRGEASLRREPTWKELADENRNLRKELADYRTTTDERIAKIEERMDARDRAFASVLADAAEQWPRDVEGPVFRDEDLRILEDTMPVPWRGRRRRGR